MIWRLGGGKQVQVHVALFADIIVLMQQQEDRLVLRNQNVFVPGRKFDHGPVMKLQELIVQPYAAGAYFCTLMNSLAHYKEISELLEDL